MNFMIFSVHNGSLKGLLSKVGVLGISLLPRANCYLLVTCCHSPQGSGSVTIYTLSMESSTSCICINIPNRANISSTPFNPISLMFDPPLTSGSLFLLP
jgi:hypothetical protein